jgi:hypothetical protein
MSSGSSILAITFNRPPQRTHCSISIPNTRFRRRAKIDRFSMDLLVRLAARAGLKPKLNLAA